MNINHTNFLDSIKDSCIDMGILMNINPSVIAALAFLISDNGKSDIYIRANNIFALTVDKSWFGKCYSKDSKGTYQDSSKCKEIGTILYRSYEEPNESIKDFLYYIKNCRRSENGPLRYQYFFKVSKYKESTTRIAYNGFVQDYLNSGNNDIWYNDIIKSIEDNKLYQWDIEMEEIILSKKRTNKQNVVIDTPQNNIQEVEEFENPEHMYRVRLDWDKPDTQIFSSPVYDDALKEAKNHEGYKVYIDDDGELFSDPWMKEEVVDEKPVVEGIKPIIHPAPGKIIKLDNAPIYHSSIDKGSFIFASGSYYFYDSIVINGRARIVADKEGIDDPNNIIGYINIR